MPIYMDRHDLPGEITAEHVAAAHQEDLKVQDQFGCRGLTYWFDESRGTAFCLIEAPNKESVQNMHNLAHGLIPHLITEVDSRVVYAFLGRIEDPPKGKAETELNVINESAYRAILVTRLWDMAILKAKHKPEIIQPVLNQYNQIIRNALKKYGGREVRQSRIGFTVSFSSALGSVECAMAILRDLQKHNTSVSPIPLHLGIGISTDPPVTESQQFFESTVQLAERLSAATRKNRIMLSTDLRDLITEAHQTLREEFSDIRMLTPGDEAFLNRLIDIMEHVWNNPDFMVGDLGKKMGLSKAQLYRNTVAITGYPPNGFIKEFRLNKAIEAIEKQKGNISQVAYESGFSSPSYFSKCFHERFGIPPSAFAAAPGIGISHYAAP